MIPAATAPAMGEALAIIPAPLNNETSVVGGFDEDPPILSVPCQFCSEKGQECSIRACHVPQSYPELRKGSRGKM